MRFRSQAGGRRALEESLRKSEKRAADLEAALTALMPGEGGQPPPGRAAAPAAGAGGRAVRATVDGREVIAVISGEGGSEAEWAAAIREGLARRVAS